MTGTEFARLYGPKGLYAWESAALDLARKGLLTPWPWVPVDLQTDDGHTATIQVRSDVLSVGTFEDRLRLPLTPTAAQTIANLDGSLLPTPWIVYQTWRQAPVKLTPTPITSLGEMNQGPVMRQYEKHSQAIDAQIAAHGAPTGTLTSGQKKDVVVSNIQRPGTVLIFGWYYPERPDVFDDKTDWRSETRQPRQVRSNAHADGYLDYSHGIRLVHPVAMVDGRPMRTVDLYTHPTLSKLVSNEGPVRVPRYPTTTPPAEVILPAPPLPNPDITSLEAAPERRAARPGLFLMPSTPERTADLGLLVAYRLFRRRGT